MLRRTIFLRLEENFLECETAKSLLLTFICFRVGVSFLPLENQTLVFSHCNYPFKSLELM